MNRPWSKRRRYTRAFSYTAVGLAGICAIIWQPPSVRAAVSPLYAVFYLWAILLVVGGFVAAVDAARGRWLGEYVGLWPLIVSCVAFSLATASNGRGLISAAGVCLLAGLAGFFYARWLDVALLRKDSVAVRNDRTGDGTIR